MLLTFLLSKLHFSDEEFLKVKYLLIEFNDLFSVSNNTIWRANDSEFHINTDTIHPISTPLHKESIVNELL